MLPHDVASGCASFAVADLPVLAGLRADAGIRVFVTGTRVWVMWEGDGAGVLNRVLPLPGAVVYECHDGLWFRRGSRLPSFDIPADQEAELPLSRALVPMPVFPIEPKDEEPQLVRLSLVRDERPRPATALRCTLDGLAAWAERATSAQLGALRAAHAGEEVLLMGRRLPLIADGLRYWGDDVWTPLGFRPEPELREAALRNALVVASTDVLVLGGEGFEAVPRDAFRILTRPGVRLARERRGHSA